MKCFIHFLEVAFAINLLLLGGWSGWRVFARSSNTTDGTQSRPGTVLLCILFVIASFYGLAILQELVSNLPN